MSALFLLLLVWFQYCLLTINYRAIAQGKYFWAGLTDSVIALCGFTLFKLIADSHAPLDVFGYMVGGTLGGTTGIYLTRRWNSPAIPPR